MYGQCAKSRGRVVLVDVSFCIGVSSHTILINDVQNNDVMCDMQRRSPQQFEPGAVVGPFRGRSVVALSNEIPRQVGAWRRGWSIPWLVRGCFVRT